MRIKAVGFDFVGTLVQSNADHELCMRQLIESLEAAGLEFSADRFKSIHAEVVHKYRDLREMTCIEVNNEVWVSETLRQMGHSLEPSSEVIKVAVDAYFQPYVDTLYLSPKTLSALSSVHRRFATCLISNFTVARAIHKSIRELGLHDFLDRIVVSEEKNVRKPHPKIFRDFLDAFDIKPQEAVFVGDSMIHDIYGAKSLGMKTILVMSKTSDPTERKITCPALDPIEPDAKISSIDRILDVLDKLCK
jgi:putative hydrolase of the HAD superfamily